MHPTLETGAPLAEAGLVAIMIHGRGRNAEEMAALGEAFALPAIRFLCPRAPGSSWYPGRFLETVENNQPALDIALGAMADLLDGLSAAGFPAEKVVLCGFSQGACLAAELLVRRPAAYAAALLFTGGLIGPPGTIWTPAAPIPAVPVLLTGGEQDEWVPAWRTRETATALSSMGASVEMVIYQDRPHVVCDDEIGRARHLLEARLST